MLAQEVMTKDVLTLTPDMSVDEARDLFFRNHIHGAPVVDHSGRLVGMVSVVDLAGRFGTRVLHVMRRDLVTGVEDSPIGELAALMLTHEIRRIPIVRDTQVVGIVSASDVIGALLDFYEGRSMRTSSAREIGGPLGIRKGTRAGKKRVPGPAEIPEAARSQEEEVTPEEMTPVAVGSLSTEDTEDREERSPAGDEWPG